MSDPILPLRVWPEGIFQARVPANDNALRVEAMSRPCLGVANDESSPENGDAWLVGSAPTGAFALFDENDIALYQNLSWYAWAPVDGLPLIVNEVRKIYVGGSTSGWEDDPSVTGGGGGMTNPMTTAGDMIIGGVSGAPTRVGIGTNAYVWTVTAGVPGWAAPGGGSGDVVGPASATADAVALYDGTTGKLLKDGVTIATIKQVDQNSQSTAYTLVLADAGKHILHPSADTTARTMTIPANGSVAFPIGTALTFVNQDAAGVMTIAITTDTMRLAGAGTTGSRTLAANGIATALKITSTEWIINGTGLS